MLNLSDDRRLAVHYFNNLALHPTNERSKASFHKLSNRPQSGEISGILAEHRSEGRFAGHLANLKETMGTWRVSLMAGFNLLLHGYGSKIELVDQYVKDCLPDYNVLTVRAYKREVTINDLLESIYMNFMGLEKNCRDPVQYAKNILMDLPANGRHVVIVVHVIEAFRSESSQEALSILAGHPIIHLICTTDHTNIVSLWTPSIFYAFSFISQECTTFVPYKEELVMLIDGASKTMSNGRATLQSCKMVIQVLPASAKQVYRVLVEYQLASMQSNDVTKTNRMYLDDDDGEEEDEYDEDIDELGECSKNGLAFFDWFNRCQQQLIISSESSFRIQVTEFVDHHLVIGFDSPTMTYVTPFNARELGDILSFLKQ